jgi:hypothetical protein
VLELPSPGGAERRPLARRCAGADVRARMACTRRGIIGADARPNWKEQPARERLTGVQWR